MIDTSSANSPAKPLLRNPVSDLLVSDRTNVRIVRDCVLRALYCTGKMDGPARVKTVKNTKPAKIFLGTDLVV